VNIHRRLVHLVKAKCTK